MKLALLVGLLCVPTIGWCGQEGSGGDIVCQNRIELIRNNIEERLSDGSVNSLDFTGTGTTAQEYVKKILPIMEFTRNEQSSISCTTNPKDVSDLVGGTWSPICAAQWLDENSVKPENRIKPRILCYSGVEKDGVYTGGLMGMSGNEQYGQIAHEFNVLAELEDQKFQYSNYLIARRVSEKARAITYWLWPAAADMSEPTESLRDSEREIVFAVIQNSDKIPPISDFFHAVTANVSCASGRWDGGILFEIRDVLGSSNQPISFVAPVVRSLTIIPLNTTGCSHERQFLRSNETHLLEALMRSKSTLDLARATGFTEIISAKSHDSFDRREYRIEIGRQDCDGGIFGARCDTRNLGMVSISVTFLPPTAIVHVVSHFIPKRD